MSPNLILDTPDSGLQWGQDLPEGVRNLLGKNRNGETLFLPDFVVLQVCQMTDPSPEGRRLGGWGIQGSGG